MKRDGKASGLTHSRRAAVLLAAAAMVMVCGHPTHADILRWDTGQVIPGTEGINPGPGMYLNGWNTDARNLRYANFVGFDFSGGNFTGSWLDNARFVAANLTNVNFGGTTLSNANLSNAVIKGADFSYATGFTKEQLYSTNSYQAKDLSGIGLCRKDLSGWNFASQNLTSANFFGATLSNTNLSNANLTNASFVCGTLSNANLSNANLTKVSFVSGTLSNAILSNANLTSAVFYDTTLTNANLSNAVIKGANFYQATDKGFTKEQLYSTASYLAMDLSGIILASNDLSSWNFAGQNLANAYLYASTLSGANMSNAAVKGADLSSTTTKGFTKEQLYSTASYQAKDLSGTLLGGNDLSGWNLSGQNLANASFSSATLTNAAMSNAVVNGADFGRTVAKGFTQEQLYSTASYQAKELGGIRLWYNDLSGWGFAGQNLTKAHFDSATLGAANLCTANLTDASLSSATLSNANLSGANLTHASFSGAILSNADLNNAVIKAAGFGSTTSGGFTKEQLYSTASYQAKDLSGILLTGNDLSGWNFAGQNLTNTAFMGSILTGADLSNAVVKGAYFNSTTATGFTREQLYSTASYQANDLSGIRLSRDAQHVLSINDLSGWNFADQNLTHASFDSATLTNTDFSRADLRGAYDLNATGAIVRNMIWPNGAIHGLSLTAAENMRINNYPLPITIDTTMTTDSTSALQMLLSDGAWGSTISFASGLTPQLGGTLRLTLADGVNPTAFLGTTFDLFNWPGTLNPATNHFAAIDMAGLTWDTTRLYTDGTITLLAATLLPGDTNADGRVDVTDLGALASYWQQTVTGGLSMADYNGDCIVNVTDLGILASNWQAGTSGAPSLPFDAALAAYPALSTVPEPTTLSALAATLLLLSRRRSSR